MNALKGTANEWLLKLLVAMNHGLIGDFNTLLDTHKAAYAAQPALVAKAGETKQKVVLMCLISMVFERHPHDRVLAFVDISLRTQLPLNQVEWVLMKAMSLDLIQGKIDQIAETVEVTWVVPRVLEKEQLETLSSQLKHWVEK